MKTNRRKLLAVCSLLVFALWTADLAAGHRAPAADAGAANRPSPAATKIPCANRTGAVYGLRYHPRQCAIFAYNGSFGGGANLARLHWAGWGGRHAGATGIEKGFHLPFSHIPALVLAYRRVRACGHFAYSRLRVRTRFGAVTVRLHVCGGHT